MTKTFDDHLNPGQDYFMKRLGFDKVKVERAEGMYYIDQNGRRILDFFVGFGSPAFGHRRCEAPAEYWQRLGALCDQYGILWVTDEVQCGYGRTWRFYAFAHYDVVPDITGLAKSLGGGRSAVGAMIARREVYLRAYGPPQTARIHAGATLGDMRESCVTAIEALHILYDEGPPENAAEVGSTSSSASRRCSASTRASSAIRMVGVEFNDPSMTLPKLIRPIVRMRDHRLKGSVSAFVAALLLRDYRILQASTEYNRNVIRLEPPLITRERRRVRRRT